MQIIYFVYIIINFQRDQLHAQMIYLNWHFQLATAAKMVNVGTPDEMLDKLHGSLVHLLKFSIERCKMLSKVWRPVLGISRQHSRQWRERYRMGEQVETAWAQFTLCCVYMSGKHGSYLTHNLSYYIIIYHNISYHK